MGYNKSFCRLDIYRYGAQALAITKYFDFSLFRYVALL